MLAPKTASKPTARTLARLSRGQAAVILRVDEEEPGTRQYLATLGLVPGALLRVEETAPFGGPLLVRTGRARYALGRQSAAKIAVGGAT